MGVAMMVFALALAATPSPTPTPAADKPARKKLDLGPYAAPAGGTPKVEALTDTPRFEATIEVEGKAPPDYNQTMSVWWAHFNFTDPAVYGHGTAFRQPPPKGSVDVTPLVGWVADKVRDHKRNRQKVPTPEASPSPGATPSPAPSPSPKP